MYVGVYDDATVAHYKGRRHPVMSVHERVLNVLQCVHVDEVVIGAPFDVTQDLIKTLNVAVVARCKSDTRTLAHAATPKLHMRGISPEDPQRSLVAASLCVTFAGRARRLFVAPARSSPIPSPPSSRSTLSPTFKRREWMTQITIAAAR